MVIEGPDEAFTEPLIVPCLYVTGAAIDASDITTVRVVGWVSLPHITGETAERRIVVRFAMPNDAGRALANALRKALARGSH